MDENLTIFHHTKKIFGSLFLGVLLIFGLLITTIFFYYFLLWEVPIPAYTEPRVKKPPATAMTFCISLPSG